MYIMDIMYIVLFSQEAITKSFYSTLVSGVLVGHSLSKLATY